MLRARPHAESRYLPRPPDSHLFLDQPARDTTDTSSPTFMPTELESAGRWDQSAGFRRRSTIGRPSTDAPVACSMVARSRFQARGCSAA